jgi:endonuclease/exonuclease/phosphatase family metal-dependent hydrolase
MINVLTWNMRRSNANSNSWDIIRKLSPDICLLQEVSGIPNELMVDYKILQQNAINKNGALQKFSTVILSKEPIEQFRLKSPVDWVSKQLDIFSGNFLCGTTTFNGNKFNLVSVYSPAWVVNPDSINYSEIKGIKLDLAKEIWPTEILYSGLINEKITIADDWIISGDFNTSTTFDTIWPGGPRGCQEIIDRLYSLNLKEALYEFNQKLVPTFRNPKGGKIIHQIDHVFISERLFTNLLKSNVLIELGVFENKLSDHYPILTRIT